MTTPEAGMRILVDTGCKVGAHTFITIGRMPKDEDVCKCGLVTWGEQNQDSAPAKERS